MLPRRMEGRQDYTRYSWKHRSEGALSSCALFPNPKSTEARPPIGEVIVLNFEYFLLFFIRMNDYL